MVGDLFAGGEPDITPGPRVVEKPLQGLGPTGATDQTAMQPDRHHLGRARDTLGVQCIESGAQVVEELFGRIEPLRRGKAHIVAVQRIGHDQLIPVAHFDPIGQVVGIGVGDIGEGPCLGGQPDRVFR